MDVHISFSEARLEGDACVVCGAHAAHLHLRRYVGKRRMSRGVGGVQGL